jgi:hypothetical protein
MTAPKEIRDPIRQSAARTPQENTTLDRQFAATDAQIDRLDHDFCGLTENEIKIVERATA